MSSATGATITSAISAPEAQARVIEYLSFAKIRSARDLGVSLVRAASLELIDRRVLSLLITVLACDKQP
jgi:hypothetical protein